jgi:predicted phage terminase large subunit-like protein
MQDVIGQHGGTSPARLELVGLADIARELESRGRRPRSPAALAKVASRGRWLPAPHLDLLDRKLVALAEGVIKRLIVEMPPRHGKSELCSRFFPSWFLGRFPHRRAIWCSYEHGFAASWGMKARDVLAEHGPELFGVKVREDVSARDDWGLEGYDGGMTTAGVGGAITGRGANIFGIDDYCKNSEQANSETYREKLWQWWTTTAYTRLEPEASALIVATRWHEDDLIGRILTRGSTDDGEGARERWEVISLPAIAEDRGGDALGREPGMPLWPARWPLQTLLAKKREVGEYVFSALYQQRPAAPEGNYFKRHWFDLVDRDRVPKLKDAARAWDLAATAEGEGGNRDPDWLAGVKMGRGIDGIFYIVDVKRDRVSPEGVERLIRQTAEFDGHAVKIRIEQEGGASGKLVRHHYTRMLEHFDARFTSIPRASKFTRSGAFNAACERRDVRLVRGPWNEALVEELANFPQGKHDDQVDACVGAFEALTRDDEPWTEQDLRHAFGAFGDGYGDSGGGEEGGGGVTLRAFHEADRQARRKPVRNVDFNQAPDLAEGREW